MHKKITTGFVIQDYKTLPNGTLVCVKQDFIAGDQVDYEDKMGEPVEIDTSKEVYCPFEMKAPKQIPDEKGLIFTCPSCKGHRLECCEDGAYNSEVLSIDEDGDFDYGEISASGCVDRFQCLNCGHPLEREDGSNIDDNEEVIEWIKENCPQSE